MSYDLRLAVKIEDGDKTYYPVLAMPEHHSPTYNIGTMFRKCMDWDFEQGTFYRVDEVLPKIERGIHELQFNEEAYKQYNSPNGWGNTDSALRALTSLVECIRETQQGWNCWEAMPLHLLWVAW